jgi:hypothetical protein
MAIKAELFSMELLIDLDQYKLVRGLLDYNLGENLARPFDDDTEVISHFQELERAMGASSEHLPDDVRSNAVSFDCSKSSNL